MPDCFPLLYRLYDFLHFPCVSCFYFVQVTLRCRLVMLSCPADDAIEGNFGEIANEPQLFSFARRVRAKEAAGANLLDERFVLRLDAKGQLRVGVGLREDAAPQLALRGENWIADPKLGARILHGCVSLAGAIET